MAGQRELPSPEERARRLKEHKDSMAHRGPDPGGTVRVTMRSKLVDEKPTVRKMYDAASQPKRKRRKKGK